MKEKVIKFIKNCFWLSSEDGKNSKEIYVFNAMRFIAFLFIFFSHTKAYFKDVGLHQSHFGVAFFFIISGFLNGYLKKSVDKLSIKSVAQYVKKKMSKIYPLLLFVIFVMLPWAGFFNIKNWDGFFTFLGKLIPSVTMTSSWINDEPHYFAFFAGIWYISTFFFLIVLTPFLMKIITKIHQTKHGVVKLLVIASVIYGLSIGYALMVGKQYYFCKIFPPARLFEYSISMIIGYLMSSRNFGIVNKNLIKNPVVKKTLYTVLETLSVLAVVAVCVYITQNSESVPPFLSKNMNIFTIPIILMLCAFVGQKGFLSYIFSNKPMVLLGRASMYLYLLHMPIRQYMDIKIAHKLPYGIFILIVTIIISLYLYNKGSKHENSSSGIQKRSN